LENIEMPSQFPRREFLKRTSIASATLGIAAPAVLTGSASAQDRNSVIRVATIGLRGKGQHHMNGLETIDGVEITTMCDIDESILGSRTEQMEERTGRSIKRYKDYRDLCADPDVDVVSIATCNHTHTLIAIEALAAGKDVYVEKPCCHNVWEGRQLVNAARKYGRMCQHGTQGRSSPAIIEGIQKIRDGVIGDVYMARGLCFKWRPSIGITPDEPVPASVDYDLWLGPAPKRAFSQNRFHYNWHWHWDYGNGDMGNQGVHEMDMARWGLGVGLPKKIQAAGGHYMFDDDQETPNSLICTYEYPDEKKMLVFETRHWITNQEGYATSPSSNAVGVTFYGSEGYMQVYYFGYKTFLGKGREQGPGREEGSNEYERFIAGVKSRNTEDLGVDIEDGFLSSSLCHLGNIAYRTDRTVVFDPETETFPGDEEANAMLSRDYRAPFVVPEVS
jgi:predicted dehydrogenase